jgi:hypothetical protein
MCLIALSGCIQSGHKGNYGVIILLLKSYILVHVLSYLEQQRKLNCTLQVRLNVVVGNDDVAWMTKDSNFLKIIQDKLTCHWL